MSQGFGHRGARHTGHLTSPPLRVVEEAGVGPFRFSANPRLAAVLPLSWAANLCAPLSSWVKRGGSRTFLTAVRGASAGWDDVGTVLRHVRSQAVMAARTPPPAGGTWPQEVYFQPHIEGSFFGASLARPGPLFLTVSRSEGLTSALILPPAQHQQMLHTACVWGSNSERGAHGSLCAPEPPVCCPLVAGELTIVSGSQGLLERLRIPGLSPWLRCWFRSVLALWPQAAAESLVSCLLRLSG